MHVYCIRTYIMQKLAIPLEQAEWVGLTLSEAMQKQWEEEKKNGKHVSDKLRAVSRETRRVEYIDAGQPTLT